MAGVNAIPVTPLVNGQPAAVSTFTKAVYDADTLERLDHILAEQAAGLTGINAEVEGKAKNSYGTIVADDLFAWADSQTFSGSLAVTASTTINRPMPGWWLFGRLDKSAPKFPILQLTEAFSGRTFIAHKDSGAWRPWTEIVTATPPQEFDLPLAAGIHPVMFQGMPVTCSYYKTQDGEVCVSAHIESGAVIAQAQIIATLPEGFRRSVRVDFPAAYYESAGASHSGFCMLYADGTLRCAPPVGAAATGGFFFLRFVATA